ncbi:MAG TPA: hypothetical protein VGF41_10465 [Myxococcaceae bacterium]
MLQSSDAGSRTHRKASDLNADPRVYGTFAEIGAGQEVARWFFQVGGASRTVAKSISAYDMAVSDSFYGPARRYVSRQRLEAMLDREYGQVVESLGAVRGERTTFFAFADTVATQKGNGEQHGRGWVGLRFQAEPRQPPSTIILHVHLLDRDPLQQQEALGVLGVNLIFAAFHTRSDLPTALDSLLHDLSRERVEIDMIKVSGPAFPGADNRIASLQLVERRLTDAAMFTAGGEVVQPSEVLYRKPILVERGSFRPATKLTVDLLDRARDRFRAEPEVRGVEPVVLAEMTLNNLRQPEQDASGPADFLARAEILHALGIDVLVSRFGPFYQLADYLSSYTDQPIGIALGLDTLNDVFDEQFSNKLDGGALESVGRLFKRSVKVYVYPMRDPTTGKLVTVLDPAPTRPADLLREFVLGCDHLRALEPSDPELLSIRSPDVLARIRSGDPAWITMVPPSVAARIQAKGLFGHSSSRTTLEG